MDDPGFLCRAMPEILVDILKVKDLYSGLGQFSANFAQALSKAERTEDKVHFLAPGGYSSGNSAQADVVHPGVLRRYFPALNEPYDLWHSLHQFPSFRPHPRSKWILTIHDLNFLVEKDPAKAKHYLRRLQDNVDRATAVTVISGYTGQVISDHIDVKGKAVHVIHNGVMMPAGDPGAAPPRPYFLSLGVFKEKKNFHLLPPLLKEFPEHDLVLAGNHSTPYGEVVRKQVQELGLTARVRMPGAVDEQEKFRLYTHCDAFLFPSAAEGFGLPVVEAMMLGKPVFLNRSTSLPEVGGDAAFYFESMEATAIARNIRTGLALFHADPAGMAKRTRSHAAQFSWEACIAKYIELYSEVLAPG